ncbi:hypothetical protein BDZ97DRAFT_1903337 [Flammula alnicola]|nr:hypothetical protein BDZ97DRAFT_1903337 [Flammula alnicola]
MTLSNYQFDSADADVILLTTEAECSTEFHVHKCILAAASPFFYDMFSLPQEDTSFVKKLPIIPVSETIAIKYDFITAITTLRKLLISPQYLQSSPIRVYAIACQFELEEEAKVASRHTLNVSLLDAPPCEELRYISAYDYHRLLALHRRRSLAALNLIKVPVDLKCMHCNSSAFTMHDAPKWWYEFERKAKEELAVRPATDVIFGMEFLFNAAQASGCTRCPESVLDSWKFLQSLKEAIDAVPSTVTTKHDDVL